MRKQWVKGKMAKSNSRRSPLLLVFALLAIAQLALATQVSDSNWSNSSAVDYIARMGALFNPFTTDGTDAVVDTNQVQALVAFIISLYEANSKNLAGQCTGTTTTTHRTNIQGSGDSSYVEIGNIICTSGGSVGIEWVLANGHDFEGSAIAAEELAAGLDWPSLSSQPTYFKNKIDTTNTKYIGDPTSKAARASGIKCATSTDCNRVLNGGYGLNAIDTVVGGLTTVETKAHDALFVDRKIVQVHSFANGTELGQGSDYPFKIQTVPIESFQGMVLQNLMCLWFNYHDIAIWYVNDNYGAKAQMEVQDGTYCDRPNVLSQHAVLPFTTDFSGEIDKAIAGGSKVHIFFMEAALASRIIEQGYSRGLFKKGMQLLGPTGVTDYNLYANMTDINGAYVPSSVVADILEGYIGIKYAPSYSLRGAKYLGTKEGADFVDNWQSEIDTGGYYANLISCDTKDSLGNYVFRRGLSSTGTCALWSQKTALVSETASSLWSGANFASMFTAWDGSDIYPYAPHAYDAVTGAASGLGFFDFSSSSDPFNGIEYVNYMMNNVSFNGTTGYNHYFYGMNGLGFYAHGDREEGHTYTIWNFAKTSYLASELGSPWGHNNDSAFNLIGTWTVCLASHEDACLSGNNGVHLCSAANMYYDNNKHRCHAPVFNGIENNSNMTSDRPPYTLGTAKGAYWNSLTTSVSAPQVLKIGGFFKPVDLDSGTFDYHQAQSLEAFLMAIEEINADQSILMVNGVKTRIVYSVREGNNFAGAVTAASFLAEETFGKTGVHAVVGAGNSVETMASNQMLKSHKIIEIHTVASDAALGDGNTYPYKLQTTPIDSFQGMIYQKIMCTDFKYSKLTIFATNDNLGSKSTIESADGTYCEINVLSKHSFRMGQTDFTEEIDNALSFGAQIFSIFADPVTAGLLLYQGWQKGLFHEGCQIFGNSYVAVPETWLSIDPSAVKAVMKGFIGLKYAPSYALQRPGPGASFVSKFQKRKNTVSVDSVTGKKVCNTKLDSASNFYLYREQLLANESADVLCTGLTFSDFKSPIGVDIYPHAPHAYDAVWSLAYGFDYMFSLGFFPCECDSSVTTAQCVKLTGCYADFSDRLMGQIMFNTSFTGATGIVHFYEGMPSFGGYARGDREEGHYFTVWNWQPDAYDVNASMAMQYVGIWTVEDGLTFCTDKSKPYGVGDFTNELGTFPCKSMVYNTVDGLPALDTPLPIVIDNSTAVFGLLIAVGLIMELCLFGLTYVLVNYRHTKLIKASQPGMLGFIVCGGIIGGIRVITGGLPVSDGSCVANFWLGHMAFWFTFGALLVKTWRVNKIVNNTSLKRIKITADDVFRIMCGLIFTVNCYLAIATGVGMPHKSSEAVIVANQRTDSLMCSMNYAQFNTALYAFEFVTLAYGMNLCYAVKDVPDAVNESKPIATSITIILVLCSLIVPIVYLIDLTPEIQRLISSLGFFAAGVGALSVLFGPKVAILLDGKDISGLGKIVDAEPKASAAAAGQVAPEADEAKRKADKKEDKKDARVVADQLLVASDLVMKGSFAERIKVCREQVNHWRAMLMQLEERASSGSGSGSGGSGSGGGFSSSISRSESVVETEVSAARRPAEHLLEASKYGIQDTLTADETQDETATLNLKTKPTTTSASIQEV